MVVKLVPGESELVRTTLSIKKTIILVLVASDADRREVIMINPDPSRCLNVDEIHLHRGAVELDVPDDDVVGLLDAESTISDTSILANTED